MSLRLRSGLPRKVLGAGKDLADGVAQLQPRSPTSKAVQNRARCFEVTTEYSDGTGPPRRSRALFQHVKCQRPDLTMILHCA